jgi:hypothetical protein
MLSPYLYYSLLSLLPVLPDQEMDNFVIELADDSSSNDDQENDD